MVIRPYRPFDCQASIALFYDTVHTINAADYTLEQINVWAPNNIDTEKWNESLLKHYSLVAEENSIIIGFGDIDTRGYLDRLYVHKDFQRHGIATALCEQLEQTVKGKIITYTSITARPYFEKRGYTVIRENFVERQGIRLGNFLLEKDTSITRNLLS